MNVYTMPGVAEMGMVWMGSGQPNSELSMDLITGTDNADMVLDQDNPYYTALHSGSNDTSMGDIAGHGDSVENLDMMQLMDMKQESNDSSYTEDDPNQVYMITTATQTAPFTSRKIKPIRHPGLVLKTPIAYHSNTDPSVIPIHKDGIAICEKCGAIGVKHAFYTRERRFCSMACARGYNAMMSDAAAVQHHHMASNAAIGEDGFEARSPVPASISTVPPTVPEPLPQANQYAKHQFTLKTDPGDSDTETEVEPADSDYETEQKPLMVTDQPLPQLAYVSNSLTQQSFMRYSNGTLQHASSKHAGLGGIISSALLNQEDLVSVSTTGGRKRNELNDSYDWEQQLSDANSTTPFTAAPVNCFKHAPLADIWSSVTVGMKVEVENTDCDGVSDQFSDSFWVATVLKLVGYKALLRYEGFGTNSSKDFWVSLCSNKVHSVGWCATLGKPLIPPKSIENKYTDWKNFLSKRLTGARTLPTNFTTKANDSLKSRFRCGLNVEVVDKNRISQVKTAIVQKIVGRRLNVKYFDVKEDGNFWCHEDSPLLHPVGWAQRVGHHLVAPEGYLKRLKMDFTDEDDATDELFTPIQCGSENYDEPLDSCGLATRRNQFCSGMKLEAIDPLNLSAISVATVMTVLRCGYIMIRIDTYESDQTGGDWFCYHIKSPCIFPVGFCERYGLPLTPPKSYDASTFQWSSYLLSTRSIAAPAHLFNSYIPMHGFVVGMKIEAADLMDPRLVCVATVASVAGRLLKVHFDGWDNEFDQWLDCESPDIYPVGWCQSVGYKLEGPPNIQKQLAAANNAKSGGSKMVKKRGRKKKCKNVSTNSVHTQKDLLIPDSSVTSDETGVFSSNINAIPSQEYSFSSMVVDDDPILSDFDKNSRLSNLSAISPTFSIGKTATIHHNLNCESSGLENAVDPNLALPNNSSTAQIQKTVANASGNKVQSSTYTKYIPRLVDNNGARQCDSGELCPLEWNAQDVAHFLRINDCANYSEPFCEKKVDGKMLMNLTREDILDYTCGKVGPSVKIYDLIQQLKIKINPSQLRHMKSNVKKFL